MSTPVVFNGVTYNIPAYNDTGYAQGTGNLSAYLIALAGGPFPFTSQTANPATAGQIRLAKTDTIDWRNNANSADLPLGINGSDQLTFNGTPLATNGGGTVNAGTAGHGAYYATSSTAISDAGSAQVSFGGLSLLNGGFLAFNNSGNTKFIDFQVGGISTSYTLVWPSNQGSLNSTFINDGLGDLSFGHVTNPSAVGIALSHNTDISPTSLVTAIVNVNLYRVSAYIWTNVADGSAGTAILTISWTDPGTHSKSVAVTGLDLTTAGAFQTITQVISANVGSNINYAVTHTGSYGASVYDLNISTESLY